MFPGWHATQFEFEGVPVPFPGWEGTYQDPTGVELGPVIRPAEQEFREMENGNCQSFMHSGLVIDAGPGGIGGPRMVLVSTLSYQSVWSVILLDAVEGPLPDEPCPDEPLTAAHGLFLGERGAHRLYQYGPTQLDGTTSIVGRIRPRTVAPEGAGGEVLWTNTYLALEHIGDVYMEVTPILNGEKIDGLKKDVFLIGSGKLTPARVELAWSRAHGDPARSRYGLRCQHFTVEVLAIDICGQGLSFAGLEHEVEGVRERIGHSAQFTQETMAASPFTPGLSLILGSRGSHRLHGWNATAGDDAGIPFAWRAQGEWVAPAGVGGEAIFTNLYLVLSRWNETDTTITVTPMVAGLDHLPIELGPIELELAAVEDMVTEVFEIALTQPHPSTAAGTERSRFAPRGSWVTARLEGAKAPHEILVLEGLELEHEIVRESLPAYGDGGGDG